MTFGRWGIVKQQINQSISKNRWTKELIGTAWQTIDGPISDPTFLYPQTGVERSRFYGDLSLLRFTFAKSLWVVVKWCHEHSWAYYLPLKSKISDCSSSTICGEDRVKSVITRFSTSERSKSKLCTKTFSLWKLGKRYEAQTKLLLTAIYRAYCIAYTQSALLIV